MKKVAIILFLGITVFQALGQNTEFSATVSKNPVGLSEHFQITYKLNNSGSDFIPPTFDQFRVLGGPNQSTSMQWINGKMSSSISYSFVLMPKKEGEFNIDHASIKVDGKVYKSNPVTVSVVKGTAPQQQAQQKQHQHHHQPHQQSSTDEQLKKSVFLKLVVDKTKLVQGEHLVATYKLYFRINILNNEVTLLPAFNGFWSQDIELPQRTPTTMEVVNGVQYNVAELKKTVLFPQRSGSFEVDPLGMDVIVRVQDNKRPQNVFEQFFGNYKEVKHSLKSNPVKIEVAPFPAKGKPDDFKGAAGKFTMQTRLSKNKITENDAINMKVTINGTGNLKLVEAPQINFPHDFEIYEPKVKDNISTSATGVRGKREFDFLVIPRHAGSFTIDPVSFSYYDPAKKQYVTLQSDTLHINVKKGEGESSTAYMPSQKEEVKLLGKDIRYIKTGDAGLKEKDDFFFGTMRFYLLSGFPILLFLLFLYAWGRLKEYHNDTIGLKSRKATKVARKHLSSAKKNMERKEEKLFYEEIYRALYGYIGDKLNMPVSDMTKDIVREHLLQRNVSDETANRLMDTLDRCEMARFARLNNITMKDIYNNSMNIIGKIERELKG